MFKAERIEPAVDLLMRNFHTVLVISAWECRPKIRMRADLLKDKRVWWWRTEFQKQQWQENGGAMLTFSRKLEEGEHDAVFFVECPRSQHLMDLACQKTRKAGCVFIPPTWRLHEEAMTRRTQRKVRSPSFIQGMRDDLARMINLAGSFPVLTQANLDRLPDVPASSLWSSARGSPEGEALQPDTSPAAP